MDILSEERDEGPGILGPRAELRELLDDFWCRYLLKEVPSIVERVQKLETLTVEDAPSELVRLYFTQAMKCYAIGLPEASMALMRACLEHALRDALPHAEQTQKLEDLLKAAGYFRKLDNAHLHMAYRVKELGNRVMHKASCSSEEAFEAVTMLRAVLGALYGLVDDDWNPSDFSAAP